MQYFIDHKRKQIHQRQYAGDRCGFTETPVEKREFTNSFSYIEQLEEEAIMNRKELIAERGY
ncbi:hypothetical protein ACSFXN_02920 [Planococcus sp. 1R117A]|uniref:hypothetical protein n=1 Tax=Planococcus sp. 1R117A TaxID=3447020 RepID=UPI003EDBC073